MTLFLDFLHRAQASAIAKTTGCKSPYSFMRLPFHSRVSQVVPDAMHTIKVAVEHVFNVITGKEDSLKVRKAECDLGRFGFTSESISGSSKKLSPAPYRLSKEEIAIANTRISSIVLPAPDFTPGPIFTKATGLKSHDWKEVRHDS